MLFDPVMHQNLAPLEFWRSRSFGDLSRWSHVSCLSTFSKDLSSETIEPISFKFHMQSSSKGGEKVSIFGSGHLTKMAGMPIYVKNLKIFSSPEPLG